MLSFNDGINNFPNCKLLPGNTFLYNLINTQVSHMLADRGRDDFVPPVRLWLSSTPCKAPCGAHVNILYFRIAS